MQDTVIFMNACETCDTKRRLLRSRNKKTLTQYLEEYNIDFFYINESIATPAGKVAFGFEYDEFRQAGKYDFKPLDTSKSL